MLKSLLISLVALTVVISAANAQDDSVFVNLSVLDEIDGGQAVDNSSGPMFPVIKAAPKKVVKPAPKKAPKKPIVKVEAKPVVEVAEAPKPAVVPYVEAKEEVVVVDVEPVTAQDVEDKSAESAVAPVVPAVSSESLFAEPVAPVESKPVVEVPVVAPTAAPVYAPVAQEAKPSELLVDTDVVAKGSVGVIKFEDQESSLTETQKAQIDSIISGFADAANNKIAIYSYNLEDGVDSFKKKRLSLNRAVEVRSYLLQKGYKNFSIKVLNLETASDRINTVELEELK